MEKENDLNGELEFEGEYLNGRKKEDNQNGISVQKNIIRDIEIFYLY